MAQFFSVHPDNPQPRLLRQAAEIVRERLQQSALPGAHLTRTAQPAPGEGVISFRARMPGEWHVNGRSTVHVDLEGSEVLLVHDATAQAAGARMTEAIYPLHIGAVGGLLMRLLTALAGLVPAFLLTTGFLFWLRRLARK